MVCVVFIVQVLLVNFEHIIDTFLLQIVISLPVEFPEKKKHLNV